MKWMKALLLWLVLVAFLDLFALLPISSPLAVSVGATPFLVGVTIGVYSFTNLVSNVVGGMGIDRFGANRVIAFGLLATAFSLFLYTVFTTPEQLIGVRAIHGLFSGLLAPSAFSLMARVSKAGRHGKTMAHTGALVGIAAIIGPAAAGIISGRYGYDWIFYSIAILMVISAALVLLLIPRAPRKTQRASRTDVKEDIIAMLKTASLTNVFMSAFILFYCLGVVTYLIPLRAKEISDSGSLGGMMIGIFGVVAVLFFLLPTNHIYDKHDASKIIVLGMGIVVMSQLMLAVFSSVPTTFISMAIFGFGFALMFPSMTKIIVDVAPEEHRGKAFGIFYACFSLGVIAGSFVTGLLQGIPWLAFSVSALFVLTIAIIISFRMKRTDV